jgi:hypothetical protein
MKNQEVSRYIQRHSELKSERHMYESLFQECFDHFLPRKADIVAKRSPGQKHNRPMLFDSTGIQANELLSATLSSGLTNPQTTWFFLTTGDEKLDRDDEVRLWMADTLLRLHAIINGSNFHSENHEFNLDLGAIGNGCMFVEEDDSTVVRFAARHIAETWIDENSTGMVDTLYREYEQTARQLVHAFGEKNVPAKIARMAKEPGDQQKFRVLHVIEPREMKGKKAGPKGYAFASKYILCEDEATLEEGGYREQPFMFARWGKASGEKYGRGPGQTALPDMKMLNLMKKTTIEGAQLTIRPPHVLPHDGYLLPIKWVPGGTIYAKAGHNTDSIKPLLQNARIDFGIEFVRMVQKQVMEAFMVERFQLPNGPQMTATEVMQRTDVMYRYMGPMLANLQHQYLRPLIDRVFAIAYRKKLIATAPEALQGKDVSVRYSSPVAKAQRASDGQSIMNAIQAAAPFIQADPAVLDNLDGDEALRHIAEIYGVPERILRARSQIQNMRQARQVQQQKMQQMQESQLMAQNIQAAGPVAIQAQKEGLVP